MIYDSFPSETQGNNAGILEQYRVRVSKRATVICTITTDKGQHTRFGESRRELRLGTVKKFARGNCGKPEGEKCYQLEHACDKILKNLGRRLNESRPVVELRKIRERRDRRG